MKRKYASLDHMIAINAVAFDGEEDKGGNPYILHTLFVMNGYTSGEIQAVKHT